MIALSQKPIDITSLLKSVESAECGGITSFLGTVRNHSKGQVVIRLDYEAYEEMAIRKLHQVAEEAREKWPIYRIAIVHRIGSLQIGEVAVAIVVACAHRAESFAACQYAIDRIKEIVPIWKKEFTENGEVWVTPTP